MVLLFLLIFVILYVRVTVSDWHFNSIYNLPRFLYKFDDIVPLIGTSYIIFSVGYTSYSVLYLLLS